MSHTFATTIPADLKAQIDKHMELFRGFVMVDAGAGANDAEGTDDDKDAKSQGADEPLGEGGMKALDAERKKALKADQARKAAEKQLAELTGVKETLDAMKAALVGTDGADTKPEEAVKAVTEKVDALQLELLVERVARKHRISSDEDIELLKSLKTPEQIETFAKRIAPDEDAADDTKDTKKGGGRPKTDPSAGQGGGESAAGKSVAQIRADRRAAREAKAK